MARERPDMRGQPLGGQQREQGRQQQALTQALQANNERLRDLTRMMERVLGVRPGEQQRMQPGGPSAAPAGGSAAAAGGAAGMGDAQQQQGIIQRVLSAVGIGRRGGRGGDEGAGFVRAQRLANLGATGIGGLTDPFRSRTETMMDLASQGGAAIAGTAVERATGSTVAGEFAASATHALIENAMAENRTRVSEMRGGMQQLEELFVSGVDVSEEVMSQTAAEFDRRGRRRAEFRRRTARAIDEQMGGESEQQGTLRQISQAGIAEAAASGRGATGDGPSTVDQDRQTDRLVDRLEAIREAIERQAGTSDARMPSP